MSGVDERHFAVTEEQRAISTFWFARALHVGPALRAAFNRFGGRVPDPVPPIAIAVDRLPSLLRSVTDQPEMHVHLCEYAELRPANAFT